MLCPYCKNKDSKVVDSRESEDTIRRRRECLKCSKRFTTYERSERTDLTIIKKDGRRESFNIDKLKTGILRACEKRPVSIEKIEKICEEIETSLMKKKETEISSNLVGEMMMKKLKKIDQVAYVRFASIYKEFGDIKEFGQEIKSLKK